MLKRNKTEELTSQKSKELKMLRLSSKKIQQANQEIFLRIWRNSV